MAAKRVTKTQSIVEQEIKCLSCGDAAPIPRSASSNYTGGFRCRKCGQVHEFEVRNHTVMSVTKKENAKPSTAPQKGVRLFISTLETQGTRKNDFSHTFGGEILRFHFECDGETVDGKCGCRRSLTGVESSKSTTTMMAVDSDLTEGQLMYEILNSLIKSGWYKKDDVEGEKAARQQAKELIRIAAAFPNSAIIEKRGAKFAMRKLYPSYTTLRLIENPRSKNGLGKYCLVGAA
jgi:hypothetical protein